MNILFDISHPAHINFFRNSIYHFHNDPNYNVYVTCLRRGKLPKIVKKELPDINLTFVGRHRGTKFSIIFEANILKFFQLLNFVIKNKIKFGLSVGSVPLGSVMSLLNKKNIQFDDDPERKKIIVLKKKTATEIYTPPVVKPAGKIKNFYALKEWAYLSPKYFKSNSEVLEELNLKPKEYIFIREVSIGSLNYMNQLPGVVLSFADKIPKEKKVILSLEDKSLSNMYPEDWIILKEPVKDIHSLIYYSFALISSGDSMAREGAQLGVPSIYCGIREMKSNKFMLKHGMLYEKKPEDVSPFIKEIIENKIILPNQQEFRETLNNKWDDVTQLIINKTEQYKK